MTTHRDAWTNLYAAALRNLDQALANLKRAADMREADARNSDLVQLSQQTLARAADTFCRIDAAAFHAATDGHAYPPSEVRGLPRF